MQCNVMLSASLPPRRLALVTPAMAEGSAVAEDALPAVADEGTSVMAARRDGRCIICKSQPRAVRFGCGHRVSCIPCVNLLSGCPLCKMPFKQKKEEGPDGHLSSGGDTYRSIGDTSEEEEVGQPQCFTTGCKQPGTTELRCDSCLSSVSYDRFFLVCPKCSASGIICPGCNQRR